MEFYKKGESQPVTLPVPESVIFRAKDIQRFFEVACLR